MVTNDIVRFGGGFIARKLAEVEKALVVFGMGGRFGCRQQSDEFRQHQGGIPHLVLGAAGVDIKPLYRDGRRGGIEVLIFDLAQLAAIDGVGLFSRKALHAEAVGTSADLLIGGEADGDGTVLDFGVCQQRLT